MSEPPELGVGVMWFAGPADTVAASDPDIDDLEFEPTVSSLGRDVYPLRGIVPPVEVAGRLPRLRAVTFEIMPDYLRANGIDGETFRRQIRDLRRVWDSRGRGVAAPSRLLHRTFAVPVTTDVPERWDDRLALAVHGSGRPSRGGLPDDPGAAIYRHLIDTMRMGNVVTALPLSYRLLTMTVGMAECDRLLRGYLAEHRPCEWAHDEVQQVRAPTLRRPSRTARTWQRCSPSRSARSRLS